MLFACNDQTSSNAYLKLSAAVPLYETHCANCHQTDGSGLARLYPPLVQSDYVMQHIQQLPSIIRNGISDTLSVNGIAYHMAMPANAKLTEEEVKLIANYVLIRFNKVDSIYFP